MKNMFFPVAMACGIIILLTLDMKSIVLSSVVNLGISSREIKF